MKKIYITIITIAAIATWVSPVTAFEAEGVDIHGFISQGFLDSNDYNYIAHNSKEGWILGACAAKADIYQPLDRLKKLITASIILFLILTGVVGLFISKSITAPINRLRDMVALISQGQDNIELDLNSNNEIGELSKSIHIMTKKIIDSHKELKESEEKFRALADTSPVAVYMSEGIEYKALYINPTFIKLFGYN